MRYRLYSDWQHTYNIEIEEQSDAIGMNRNLNELDIYNELF